MNLMALKRFCSTGGVKANLTASQQFVPECASNLDKQKLAHFKKTLSSIERLLVLTGAGISTESGISLLMSLIIPNLPFKASRTIGRN